MKDIGSVSKKTGAAPTLKYDICIVGNGAVGKAAALGLAQAGLRVALLGMAPPAVTAAASPDAWDTRVYALNHVARSLLSTVKVWNALDPARVSAVEGMEIKGGTDSAAGTLTFDAYSAHVDALAWIVEDGNLNQALDAALKFSSNVRVLGGRVKAMQVDAAAATLQLESGETVDAALVVGADGAQSWVRGQCQIGIDYRSYKQRGVVANFACERPHHGIAYQWFTENEGIVALLPLPGQRVSLVWSAPETLALSLLEEPLSQLAARLSNLAGDKLGQLQPLQPELAQAFPLSLLKTHALVAPRVALIGDAGHVVHPLAGHGMNLGFGDVTALIRVLAERGARSGGGDCGDERVLARYARARKEEILLMQMTTDGLERLFGVDVGPLRLLRNLGLNLLNNVPVLKRQLMTHALGRTADSE
ncbi:Ubiquinone biosynthesis hydroxylase, UbiH/UbiF/VisC/COQ6 family [Collimonas sp. OK307]|uniref:FAD-dependent monooxygenase n=1 Tax=Collimonas sp. OK307 TaxID=1801620 RepID=UPI0008E783EB|nr:FAD-dependent monooxygenase [Collimonas sp. OK307]SFI06901.1 Ubiquinone biosynthesis hydroxylase, UbiH/UbiF/VisC/COQ6 family [Collimonas sp. OK307]